MVSLRFFSASAIVSCALVAAAALALLHLAYAHGQASVQAQWDIERANTAVQIEQLIARQSQITTKVITRYVDRIKTVELRGKDIIKEVAIYVPAPPASGPDPTALPGGFRVYHDAAAKGELPDPARIADAAPTAAQDLATTVATNYNTCHATAEQLTALQDWIRQQQGAAQ